MIPVKIVIDLPDGWAKAVKQAALDTDSQSVTAYLCRLVEQSPDIPDEVKAALPSLVKPWGRVGKDTKDSNLTKDTKDTTPDSQTSTVQTSVPVPPKPEPVKPTKEQSAKPTPPKTETPNAAAQQPHPLVPSRPAVLSSVSEQVAREALLARKAAGAQKHPAIGMPQRKLSAPNGSGETKREDVNE